MDTFLAKTFVNSETGVHPRILTEWGKKGLLISEYQKSRHSRLSVAEFVWIKLVQQMREFNFSYDFILKVKSELVQPLGPWLMELLMNDDFQKAISEHFPGPGALIFKSLFGSEESLHKMFQGLNIDLDSVSSFDLILLTSLACGTPITVNLNKDGVGALFSPLYIDLIDQREYIVQMQRTHVTLSVSEALAEAMSITPIEKVADQLKFLSPEERQVIETLNEPNIKSVNIRFNDKRQMNLMEVTTEETVDRRTRLLEIIMTDGYQDIEVTTVKGRIVKCRNTKKVKLK